VSHFSIRCRKCGALLTEVYCAFCEHCTNALLVTEYKEDFAVRDDLEGIWRFNWLPVHEPGVEAPGPVVFESRGLGSRLGLRNLHIAFSGYWPEMGAHISTCTFKEFEAAVVLENARENGIEGLVVASAGNTARAFAHLSHKTGYPVIIVVPLMCQREMWYLESSTLVPTVVLRDGDYSDAIDLARRIAELSGMPFEGGVKNIAKRDGLGVVMLEAVAHLGRLPDHYVQAVGSGAGAVAAWEMAERFVRDERFGGRVPRLHLAQNLPFAPMYHAWQAKRRELDPEDLKVELIEQISTRVLSTRYPAYSILGGVYDAVKATDGAMYGVTNNEMTMARKLFEDTERLDIVPAAAVAVAALRQAVERKDIAGDDLVLLNITGGGESRIRGEGRLHKVKGEVISKFITDREIEEFLCSILKKSC
jgi:cysteate synthase